MIQCAPIKATPLTGWDLPLAAWAEWPGLGETEPPKLDFVDPMLRRRLSTLAKASLWVAHQCARDLADVRLIYASRHGEIARTTDMLNALSLEEGISPTAFSMSVLNATVGLYSIIRGNSAPATAIAAGAETLGYALLEAHGQLRSDPQRPVLLIYADETVPDIWQSGAAQAPHALALLLHNGASDVRIHCTRASGAGLADNGRSQAQSFVECLNGRGNAWEHEGIEWHWQKLT